MDLTTASIMEANKVASEGVYLLLLRLTYEGEIYRFVCNNENYTFRGQEYIAYNFNVSAIKRSSTEQPSVKLSISNITGAIQSVVEAANGLNDAVVELMLVNTNVSGEISDIETFKVESSYVDGDFIVFNLGLGYSLTRRWPLTRILKDYCGYKYRGVLCRYDGDLEKCGKTLEECRKHKNEKNFGGCPTVPQGGLYVRRD